MRGPRVRAGVLVAAPTGSGKTVVGEFAIHLALAQGRKCFYTTPIKALSNQKYNDLVARHGAASVGLLTGDNSINGEAPIVVMTTEVLRNMLYAGSSTLHDLGFVVMDEVHYLADRFRGAVWEEVIIHLPESVTVVALSATVSNAEEFGAWLETVRGRTSIVVEEHRPVPLWQHVMAGLRMYDLFVDDDQQIVNPELVRMAREDERQAPRHGEQRRGRDRSRGKGPKTPWRSEVAERLERDGLLPAIYFLFSRAGCDEAVRQCLHAGLRLTSADERRAIRELALESTRELPDDDLAALGFDEWLECLERGLAAHHAGLLPVFKEIVEALFQQGLLKVVFATETLALGINMPAKSVVLERLVKWNGETHVDLTPGEYTQLTGRAGRRGIDVEGHAVVLWQPEPGPAIAGRPGVHAHLPAPVVLPAVVQHGRQPRVAHGAPFGARGARDLVRPVPGRPRGRRTRHRAAPRGGGRERATATRCRATSATSSSTRSCASRCPVVRRTSAGGPRPNDATPRRSRGSPCARATCS